MASAELARWYGMPVRAWAVRLPAMRSSGRHGALLPRPDTVTDDIVAITRDAYNDAADAVAHGLLAVPGAVFVGMFGRVGLPGISDLDLLCVCEDGAYAAVVAEADALRSAHVMRRQLFTHQIFVLPLSIVALREVLFFRQSLNPVTPLAGDASVLGEPRPADMGLAAVSAALWGSTLWRVVLGLSARPCGMRELLLASRTASRQASLVATILGDADARAPLDANDLERAAAASTLPGERPFAVLGAYAAALGRWRAADRRFQEAWFAGACGSRDALLGGHHIRFDAGPDGRVPSVPPFYADLVSTLRPLFPALPLLPRCIAPRAWDAGLHTYAEAAAEALLWGRRHTGDPYVLFLRGGRGMFPSPFNAIDGSLASVRAGA